MKAPPPVASTRGPSCQQPGDDAALAVAELGLAADGEDVRDGHAGGILDLVVGVEEGQPQRLGQPAADRALAGAHQPDEHDASACRAWPGCGDLVVAMAFRRPLAAVGERMRRLILFMRHS